MNDESTLVNIKRLLNAASVLLVVGGIVFVIIAAIGHNTAALGGAVGWGAGVGATIHTFANKLIAMLETQRKASTVS